MLKIISIFLAVIVAVSCDDSVNCVSCKADIVSLLSTVQAFINGLDPITTQNVSICTNLIVSDITGLNATGDACMTSSPNSTFHTQIVTLQVATIHIECQFDDIFNVAPNTDVQSIVLDVTDVNFFFVFDFDSDEDFLDIKTMEVDQGGLRSTQFSLQGNTTFVDIAKIFTNNFLPSTAIGYAIRFIFTRFVDQLKDNLTLGSIVSLLHCIEPEP